MNLATLKSNKKQLVVLISVFVLTAILGFYGGRYYERKSFENRFFQMRNSASGQGNFNRMGSGTGVMRDFEQRVPR